MDDSLESVDGSLEGEYERGGILGGLRREKEKRDKKGKSLFGRK